MLAVAAIGVKSTFHGVYTFAQRRPLISAVGFSTFQATAADYIVQFFDPNGDNFDYKRLSFFSFFGFTYLGLWHYSLYSKALPILLKKFTKRQQQLIVVCSDQFVYAPFVYFSAFAFLENLWIHGTIRGWNYKQSLPTIKEVSIQWKLWIPATFITMALPYYARIPWMAFVSFVWNLHMSFRLDQQYHQEELQIEERAKKIQSVC